MENQLSIGTPVFEKALSKDSGDSLIPGSQFPQIGVIGASFKTASIAAREELAKNVTLEKVFLLLDQNPATFSDAQVVLLSTCNRFEFYYYTSDSVELTKSLRNLFKGISHGFRVYQYSGSLAVHHLFNVAAGLDSLVIGESQILSQVRSASRLSIESKISGPVISKLFSKAYENAKKLREEYPKFANGLKSSVSHSVIDLISREYGEKKPNVLLIGSGKMIRLASNSMERSKLGTVVMAARRKSLDGFNPDFIVDIAEVAQTIHNQKIDVVVTATSSERYILSLPDLASYPIEKRLLILDISVPRNVDPSIGKLANVTLLNLDDLKDRIEFLDLSEQETVTKMRESLMGKAAEFVSWVTDYNEILPLIATLRKKAETIRTQELDNAFSRLPDLSPDQKLVIEKMADRLIRRFLHEPTARLKKISNEQDRQRAKLYAEAILELFSSGASEELVERYTENSSSEGQK
ncbi:MAG: glutamyl-tRNA reductase [Nitrososphaerales archaeon]